MGAASDIVSVSISAQSASLTLQGFGTPLILSPHNHFLDRVRYYSATAAGLAQMVTDGFSTTDPAYLAASAIVAQSPTVVRFGIGKLLLAPTQQYDLVPQAASGAGQVYSFKMDGQVASYTSVGADSVNTIINGLKTAFDLLGIAVTSSNHSGTSLRLVANSAGAFHSMQILDAAGNPTATARSVLSAAQTHADPGIATDMAQILLADSQWYGVINLFDSSAMALALAAWVESNKKLYIVLSVDDAILGSGSSDVASNVKSSAYTRTAVLYKSENVSMAQAAWMGAKLCTVAGSENWAYATLAGIPVDMLSEGEIGNASGIPTAGTQGKRASVYQAFFGRNVTTYGQVGSGSWLDVTRGIDAFVQDIASRIFSDLSGPNKIPYTDPGVAQIVKDVKASIAFYQSPPQNFLAESPAPVVSAPAVASLSPTQKASRVLPNVTFQVNLAGALNAVQIQGVVLS